MIKYYASIETNLLTIKKQAPIITAFIRTSRSIGNDIIKLSASVNISFRSPDHCFRIRPTSHF